MIHLDKYVETSPYVAKWLMLRKPPYTEINYFKRIGGWGRAAHRHQMDYQFLLVISGSVIIEIENHKYELSAGDISFIGPNVEHSIYTDAGYEQVGVNLNNITEQDNTGLLHLLRTYADPFLFTHCTALLPKADTLIGLLKIDGHFAVTGACLLGSQMMLEALENQIFGGEKRFDIELSRYLSDHLADKLTLKQIAEHFHISTSQLERESQKFFATGVIALYNQKRFIYAVGQLRQTKLGMDDIAQSIGFNDVSNFSAFISKHGGKSPRAYRKQIEWRHKEKVIDTRQEEQE